MRLNRGLIVIVLLTGCSGYVADRLKPKSSFVSPQLGRYGITGAPAKCVEQRLTGELSTWQLRQFYNLASRLAPGEQNPAALRPWDLVYVAGLATDAEVGATVRRALQGCGLPTSAAGPVRVAEAVAPPVTPEPAPAETPVPPAPSAVPAPTLPAPRLPSEVDPGALWVNLGAAASGQGIAVDARSVTRIEGRRQAWFRLLRIEGEQIVGETGYLLRVDCAGKTVTAHAGRTYGKGGALLQQKDYEKPEGPLKIEGGTVIEVAFHALCDEAG